jgi:hypothetical protein
MTADHVANWLGEVVGLPQYVASFLAKAVDGRALSELTDDGMRKDLGVTSWGHRRKVQLCIATLTGTSPPVVKPPVNWEEVIPLLEANGYHFKWIEERTASSAHGTGDYINFRLGGGALMGAVVGQGALFPQLEAALVRLPAGSKAEVYCTLAHTDSVEDIYTPGARANGAEDGATQPESKYAMEVEITEVKPAAAWQRELVELFAKSHAMPDGWIATAMGDIEANGLGPFCAALEGEHAQDPLELWRAAAEAGALIRPEATAPAVGDRPASSGDALFDALECRDWSVLLWLGIDAMERLQERCKMHWA